MSRLHPFRSVLSLALLIGLLMAALPGPLALADGTLGDTPNPIGQPYGAPRAIDADNDASCADTQDRGDLIDFHAFSAPATNGSRWFFAFVVDSDVALDAGSGLIDRPNYIIILDDPSSNGANGTDTIPFWNSAGGGYSGAWRRNMQTPGTHFVACFETGASTLSCDLYDNYKQEVAGVDAWTVTTYTLGGRRYVELALPDDTDVPSYLRNNTTINTMVISTYNSDNWGNPIDAVGNSITLSCHNGIKEGGTGRTFTTSEMIATAANCKTGGRPTDSGTNDRQCLSLPRRDTTTQLTDIATCNAANAGVIVNGTITGDNYTLLTEASFAGPYQGGSTTQSDFTGESASYRYCDSGGTCTGITGADIVNIHARGDAYFLYLVVSGELDSFGRSGGGADRANLFIAIDLPDVTSGSAETTTVGVPGTEEYRNAPASRYVNFKGWDVDYVVEMIWHGNVGDTSGVAQLWDYVGSRAWNSVGNFTVMNAKDTGDHTNTSPPSASNLYFGRDTKTYEFAIPWAALGYNAWTPGSGSSPATCSGQCRPTANAAIRIGAYTTADPNAVSGEEDWDIYDQGPGIGQGGNGLGSHERIGDEYQDTDDDRTGAEADRTPYSGATRGTSDRSSSEPDGLDVDTIESYFQFTLAPVDRDCMSYGTPLAVTLAAFTANVAPAGVALTWETVSEADNTGFNVLRAAAVDGERTWLAFVPSANPGSTDGASYSYLDTDVVAGQTYWYWLEDVDTAGGRTLHGPVSATYAGPTAVELSGLAAGPAAAAGVPLAAALLALLLPLAGAAWAQRKRA